MVQFKLKEIKKDQLQDIKELFELVYSKERPLKFWIWEDFENIFGDILGYGLWDENKLIGLAEYWPRPLKIGKKFIKSALLKNTMIHPDYRRKGYWVYLGEKTLEYMFNNNFKVLLGLPNDMIINAHLKYGFEILMPVPNYQLDINNIDKMEIEFPSNYTSKEFKKFDSKFNDLTSQLVNSYPIILQRNPEYLEWRFNKKPDTNYISLMIKNEMNEIAGLTILKIYENNANKILNILDLYHNNQKNILISLIKIIIDFAKNNDITKITTYLLDHYKLFSEFKALSFKFTDIGRKLIVATKENIINEIDIKNQNNWYVSMSDIDVF